MKEKIISLIALLFVITATHQHLYGQSRRRGQPAMSDSMWQEKYKIIIAQIDSTRYFDPQKSRDIFDQLVASGNVSLRGCAIRAAGSFNDPEYGYPLLNIINNWQVEGDEWYLALTGLGDLRYKDAEEDIIIQRHELRECRADHSTAIGVINKALRKIRAAPLEFTEKPDPRTEKRILDSLETYYTRENKVSFAVGVLAYPGNFKAANVLISLLKNPNIDVWSKGFTAYALGQIGDKKAVPALVELCKTDTSDVVLSQAIEALGYLNAGQVRDILKRHLKDERIPVRRAAIVAAGIIKSPEYFIPLLGCAKQEKEPQAQVYLLMALGQVSKNLISPAQRELERTLKQAGKEGKKVFLAFYCNQCTNYCPVMDSFLLNATPMKEIMGRSYVYMKVETGQKNGDQRLVDKYVGPEMEGHYPFYVIMDKNGKILETSLIPGKDTVGWPEKDWEIEHFIKTIRNTGKVKEAELQEVAKQMRERYENKARKKIIGNT